MELSKIAQNKRNCVGKKSWTHESYGLGLNLPRGPYRMCKMPTSLHESFT